MDLGRNGPVPSDDSKSTYENEIREEAKEWGILGLTFDTDVAIHAGRLVMTVDKL